MLRKSLVTDGQGHPRRLVDVRIVNPSPSRTQSNVFRLRRLHYAKGGRVVLQAKDETRCLLQRTLPVGEQPVRRNANSLCPLAESGERLPNSREP